MSSGIALEGAVIAAGRGRRLEQAGWSVPKALVPVAGVPLLEHVIENFRRAGWSSLTIIVNRDSRECVDWARRRFPDLTLRFIVETTSSSLESFLTVLERVRPAPALISTVDALCLDGGFARFAGAARDFPPGTTALAVTAFVDDEDPLWVRIGDDGLIREMGGRSGDAVTAGLYLVADHIRHLGVPPGRSRLREFLGWLVARGEPVRAVRVPAVIDVDRPEDIAGAERALRAAREAHDST